MIITRLEKVRLVINQGQGGAQVMGVKRQQNICHDDHVEIASQEKKTKKTVRYFQRLSSPAAYSRFTNFIHLHDKQ